MKRWLNQEPLKIWKRRASKTQNYCWASRPEGVSRLSNPGCGHRQRWSQAETTCLFIFNKRSLKETPSLLITGTLRTVTNSFLIAHAAASLLLSNGCLSSSAVKTGFKPVLSSFHWRTAESLSQSPWPPERLCSSQAHTDPPGQSSANAQVQPCQKPHLTVSL